MKKKSIMLTLAATILLLLIVFSCKKQISNSPPPSVDENIQISEIFAWSQGFDSAYLNVPPLLYSKVEKAIFNGKFYMRIPIEGSTGYFYFTKDELGLHPLFIRALARSANQLDGQVEFVDFSSRQYQIVTYKNNQLDSIYLLKDSKAFFDSLQYGKGKSENLMPLDNCGPGIPCPCVNNCDNFWTWVGGIFVGIGNWLAGIFAGGSGPDPLTAAELALGYRINIIFNSGYNYYSFQGFTPPPGSSNTPNGMPNWKPAVTTTPVDGNGYYYERIGEINGIIHNNPLALLPCDKLNIMPLDDISGYGIMFLRIAQFQVPQTVLDRISNLATLYPSQYFDRVHVQQINNAAGPKVNCDYFPVHISRLPTGMSQESLVEYFRKNITSFITPSLGVSFSPYTSGTFSDAPFYNNSFESSIGGLVHIHMLNDGSVVESGYYRNSTSTPQKSRFEFSTIYSPLDYSHPVSGNREFGIFGDAATSSYTFYTMGVDRTSDITFSWLNTVGTGFAIADNLWRNIQTNMASYINSHGGQATVQSPVLARPNWNDVKDYLQGRIDFPTLKHKLGC